MFRSRENRYKDKKRGDISEENKEKAKPLRNILPSSSSDEKKIDPKYEQEQTPVDYAMTVVRKMIKEKNPGRLSEVDTKLPKKGMSEFPHWLGDRDRQALFDSYTFGIKALKDARPFIEKIGTSLQISKDLTPIFEFLPQFSNM